MKKTFLVEIDCPPDCENLTTEAVKESVRGILWGEYGRRKALSMEIFVKETTVEQSVERPILQDESEKPLRLSGNIAWENRTEDGEDYLEDRFNDLLERGET